MNILIARFLLTHNFPMIMLTTLCLPSRPSRPVSPSFHSYLPCFTNGIFGLICSPAMDSSHRTWRKHGRAWQIIYYASCLASLWAVVQLSWLLCQNTCKCDLRKFEGTVHHGRGDVAAGTRDSWSHCIQPVTKGDEFGCWVPSLFLCWL